MKRIHDNIKEFGNGNINIRFSPDDTDREILEKEGF